LCLEGSTASEAPYIHGLLKIITLLPEYTVAMLAILLESDRYIGDKSIYWRLTICKMTRYRRVKSKKGEEGI
jgi:hypothetical protein